MQTPIVTKSAALAAYGGNASALARALGITPSAVYQWGDGPLDERWALKLAFVLKPELFRAAGAANDDDAPAEGEGTGHG